jgi:hypothetical protein
LTALLRRQMQKKRMARLPKQHRGPIGDNAAAMTGGE